MVDSAPKIMALSSDFDEDLIQVPLPLRAAPYGFRTPFPDFMCEVSAEPIDPETDAFVANIDAALVEKIFHVPKGQREADIHEYGELDDLKRGFEVAKRVFDHFLRLNTRNGHLKSGSADNTLA